MKAGNKVAYDKLKKDIIYIIIFEPLFIFVFGFKSDLAIPLCVTVFTFLLIPDVIQCIDLSAALKSVITIGLSSLGILAYIFNEQSKKTIIRYSIALLVLIVFSILKYDHDKKVVERGFGGGMK